MSEAYSHSGDIASPKLPKNMTDEEKKQKAQELHQAGKSQGKLAIYFGVSKSTIFNWIHDYPYSK